MKGAEVPAPKQSQPESAEFSEHGCDFRHRGNAGSDKPSGRDLAEGEGSPHEGHSTDSHGGVSSQLICEAVSSN